MSREIKFRVWDSISKAFHYWGNIQNNKFNDFDLEHYTLTQFTGRKDKNGTDIYEGDVVLEEDYSSGACLNQQMKKKVVEYRTSGCIGFVCGFNIEFTTNIEVIGNIHQDPELLK